MTSATNPISCAFDLYSIKNLVPDVVIGLTVAMTFRSYPQSVVAAVTALFAQASAIRVAAFVFPFVAGSGPADAVAAAIATAVATDVSEVANSKGESPACSVAAAGAES